MIGNVLTFAWILSNAKNLKLCNLLFQITTSSKIVFFLKGASDI